MNLGSLLSTLNDPQRSVARRLEKIAYKLNSATTAVDFNTTCLLNGLLPKYTYSRQAGSRRTTTEERRHYLREELVRKKQLMVSLTQERDSLKQEWQEQPIHEDLKDRIKNALALLAEQHLSDAKRTVAKKLAALYGSPVEIPQQVNQFINLSKTTLTESQTKFLNLGLNCHYINKPKPHAKRIELEMLLEDIQRLESDKKVTTSPDLQAEIIREANTTRGHYRSSLLTPELKLAAKELRENNDIIIRKADKSSVFVILDKEDYMRKINTILQDNSKFKKITRNPTQDLKTSLNRLIRNNNKTLGAPKLPLIEGDHKVGYAYGNVKTHKQGSPLRPIISQTPAVTYTLAKRLNDLLAPFTPANYSLKSSQEFIDIIKASQPSPTMASMDVESLFTNVPVEETIGMICNKLYRSEDSPFPIPEITLRQLLSACTKEAPFYGPDGSMYVQIDGVAMGSPLGVLFANFYMGTLEEKVFTLYPTLKPPIYARYVDDIFINTGSEEDIRHIIEAFKRHSSLSFTHEMEHEERLPFLDVLVHRSALSFQTEVYVKSTNLGFCLNAASECPQKYRRSVINSFVRRALTHCSTWTSTNTELRRISQLLANNGYPKNEVDEVIRLRMDGFMQEQTLNETPTEEIPLYYKNHMSSAYKQDEKALKKIITENVRSTNARSQIKLNIYYKTKRTSSLIMKNSCLPASNKLQETSLVYEYTCTDGDCSRLNSSYIGSTITTLSKRLTAHLQDGAIKRHSLQKHGVLPTRENIEQQTNILHREADRRRLRMTEAVFIYTKKPPINTQQSVDLSLPTHRRTALPANT